MAVLIERQVEPYFLTLVVCLANLFREFDTDRDLWTTDFDRIIILLPEIFLVLECSYLSKNDDFKKGHLVAASHQLSRGTYDYL